MDPLAYVEMVGRDGRVVARHPITAFPCRVGRAYDNDVIVDDPYVAARHLELAEIAPGRYAFRDLGSRNGTRVVSRGGVVAEAEIGPDDVIRIGHTQLRVRPRDFPVAQEVDGRRRGWTRHPAISVVVALAAAAAISGTLYQSSRDALETASLVSTLFLATAMVLAWSAGWAFAGRMLSGRWNYLAHATVANVAILAYAAVNELAGAAAFALGLAWLRRWDTLAVAAVFAVQCFRHLRLASRANRRRLAAAALAVSAALVGGWTLLSWLNAREDIATIEYLTDIRPPGMRLASSVPVERFLERAAALRERLDQSRAKP